MKEEEEEGGKEEGKVAQLRSDVKKKVKQAESRYRQAAANEGSEM